MIFLFKVLAVIFFIGAAGMLFAAFAVGPVFSFLFVALISIAFGILMLRAAKMAGIPKPHRHADCSRIPEGYEEWK